jgi:hypothetical protein
MRKRPDDNPVKIIQLLPVDNEPTNRPIKRPDPVFRRILAAWRRFFARAAESDRQVFEQCRRASSFIVESPHRVDAGSNSERHVDLSKSDAISESSRAIVERPPDSAQEPGVLSRLEARRSAMLARWSQRLDGARMSTIATMHSWKDATRRSIIKLPVMLLGRTGRIAHSRDTRQRHRPWLPKLAWNKQLKKDLHVMQATLLAQQQALENTTAEVHAVQKELAAQRQALAELIRQIQALEGKVVHLFEESRRH